MKSIGTIFESRIKKLKRNLSVYTITLISGMILSITAFVFSLFDKLNNRYFQHFASIILLFMIGCFFTETYFIRNKDKKKVKLISVLYILSLMFAIAADAILTWAYDNFSEKTSYWINTYFIVFYIIILIASVYKIVKTSDLMIEVYFARAVFGLLKVWALFAILYLATILILEVFNVLITDIDYWDTVSRIEMLLCGFLYLPYSIMVVTSTSEDNSGFTKGLITYVLMPCVLIAVAIIYIYIFKIIFGMKLPNNEVFDICAYIFIIGCPIWLMANAFLEEKAGKGGNSPGIYRKTVGAMPYIYIPFVVLEIICLGIRIRECGFTEKRYLGLILIIFQIIYIMWKPVIGKLLGKKEYIYLIHVIVVLLLLTLIMPGINIMRVSYMSQKGRFEKAVEQENYSAAIGPYSYLEDTIYGEEYLKEKYTKAERNALEEKMSHYDNNSINRSEYVYFNCNTGLKDGMDIRGYSNIYAFNSTTRKITKDDLHNIEIEYGEEYYVNVDFAQTYEYFYNRENVSEDEFYEININGSIKLIITQFRCSSDKYSNKVEYIEVYGYILTK